MIEGNLVGLRAVEKEDLPKLMEWRNREDFRQFFREYRELGIDNQKLWFDKTVLGDPNTIMFSIVKKQSLELIGACGLCYINWVQRFADFSLYIGWNDAYIDNSGYAKDACITLLNYAFGEIGLHKVWTEIYEFDNPKNTLYRSLGFSQDGFLRENYFHKGTWHNSRIMSILDHEWFNQEPCND